VDAHRAGSTYRKTRDGLLSQQGSQAPERRLPVAFASRARRRLRARHVLVTAAVTEGSSSPLPHAVRRTTRAPEGGLKSAMAETAPTLEARSDRVAMELLTAKRAMTSATPVLPGQHEVHSACSWARPGIAPHRRLGVLVAAGRRFYSAAWDALDAGSATSYPKAKVTDRS
jgi:hypothetical protein